MIPSDLLAVVVVLGLMALCGAVASGEGRPPTPPSTVLVSPGRLSWPLARWTLTQGYGCTSFASEPVATWCPTGHVHTGLDLAAPSGTPVLAAGAGVAQVIDSPTGYGLHVVIDHGGGVSTLYGHLMEAAVRSGQPVRRGQTIGWVGSTGMSTGPHLHFEVRRDGWPVDPRSWLPASPAAR